MSSDNSRFVVVDLLRGGRTCDLCECRRLPPPVRSPPLLRADDERLGPDDAVDAPPPPTLPLSRSRIEVFVVCDDDDATLKSDDWYAPHSATASATAAAILDPRSPIDCGEFDSDGAGEEANGLSTSIVPASH